MAHSWLSGTAVWLFDAVFRPSVFASGHVAATDRSRWVADAAVATPAPVLVPALAAVHAESLPV